MLWTWQIYSPTLWFAKSNSPLGDNPGMEEVDANTSYVMARPGELIHDLIEELRDWQGWRTFVVCYYPGYPLNGE